MLLGDGTGNFLPPLVAPLERYARNGIAVGDFNSDGDPDVVTRNIDDEAVVLLGAGDGTLQPVRFIPLEGEKSFAEGHYS